MRIFIIVRNVYNTGYTETDICFNYGYYNDMLLVIEQVEKLNSIKSRNERYTWYELEPNSNQNDIKGESE